MSVYLLDTNIVLTYLRKAQESINLNKSYYCFGQKTP
jgi:hypothetical protein